VASNKIENGCGVERCIAKPAGARQARHMAMPAFCVPAVAAMALLNAPVHGEPATLPPSLPPMAGIEAGSADARERAELFAALRAAKDDAEARAIEDKIWKFWRGFADEESKWLLQVSREAQLRFDIGNALLAMARNSSVSMNHRF
jgi:hypothetical protein